MFFNFFTKTKDPNEEVLLALFNNLELFITHRDLILSTPKYYNIRINGCGVYPIYISTFSLFLGDLLELWHHPETRWRQEDKYFYSISGSPLSGINTSDYWSKKKGLSSMRTNTFSFQLKTALRYIQSRKICTDHTPLLVEFPKRTKSDLTIFDLLNTLQQL